MADKPNCYTCQSRTPRPGDCHSACRNKGAVVSLNPYGVKSGWAYWPVNFDPVWVDSCDSHTPQAPA